MEVAIPRQKYLKRIEPFIGKNLIKVFTGQRRVGKSYLLFQLMEEVKKRDSEAKILTSTKKICRLHTFAMPMIWTVMFCKINRQTEKPTFLSMKYKI